jgi:hypothetical protein
MAALGPDRSPGLVAAISVPEAAPYPTEMAGTRPAMTRDNRASTLSDASAEIPWWGADASKGGGRLGGIDARPTLPYQAFIISGCSSVG